MVFIHNNKYQLQELETETINGKRHYITPKEGIQVSRQFYHSSKHRESRSGGSESAKRKLNELRLGLLDVGLASINLQKTILATKQTMLKDTCPRMSNRLTRLDQCLTKWRDYLAIKSNSKI